MLGYIPLQPYNKSCLMCLQIGSLILLGLQKSTSRADLRQNAKQHKKEEANIDLTRGIKVGAEIW